MEGLANVKQDIADVKQVIADVKQVIAEVKEGLQDKERLLQQYRRENDTLQQIILESRMHGIRSVLEELEFIELR